MIEAVGEGVTNLRPGMRVAAFTSRAYAEYCASPAFMAIPLPDSVSFVDGAAFLIQALTAYHLLYTVDTIRPGRSVLVHAAAGGVGLAAVQLAEAAGARVFGTVVERQQGGTREGGRRRRRHQLREGQVRRRGAAADRRPRSRSDPRRGR